MGHRGQNIPSRQFASKSRNVYHTARQEIGVAFRHTPPSDFASAAQIQFRLRHGRGMSIVGEHFVRKSVLSAGSEKIGRRFHIDFATDTWTGGTALMSFYF